MTPHPPGQEADLGLDRDASEAASPACHSSDSDMVLVSVSASQSPSTDPFSDGQAPVDTWRATSPALSSSSHTPSSCTLDDAAALSDVSSLDGHDFEMVHNRSPPSVPMPLSRPASMHSASSGADDSASEQSWPEERQAALVGPLPAEQLRGDIDDAAALNSSLGSAYELFCMHNSSASSSLMTPRSSFQRIPQSRACHRTAATIVQHAQTYPSASLTTLARSSTSPRPAPASDFEFPDPMGESFKFMQHQRESDDALVADNEGSIVQDEASALTTE